MGPAGLYPAGESSDVGYEAAVADRSSLELHLVDAKCLNSVMAANCFGACPAEVDSCIDDSVLTSAGRDVATNEVVTLGSVKLRDDPYSHVLRNSSVADCPTCVL